MVRGELYLVGGLTLGSRAGLVERFDRQAWIQSGSCHNVTVLLTI